MRYGLLESALRSLLLLAACGAAGTAGAQPLSVARVQRLLQEQSHGEVRFTERRESRWLDAPVESSGTLRSSAGMLERQVLSPRRETWQILADRIQFSTADSDRAMEIPLDKAPAVAALASTLRAVMAGKLEALNADFQLVLSGDERDWILQLTPRRPEVARQLALISVQGAGPRLSAIVIVESGGDRTTTRLQYSE